MGSAALENRSAQPKHAKVEIAASFFPPSQPSPFQLNPQYLPHPLQLQLQLQVASALMEHVAVPTSTSAKGPLSATAAAPPDSAALQAVTVMLDASRHLVHARTQGFHQMEPAEEPTNISVQDQALVTVAAPRAIADQQRRIVPQAASPRSEIVLRPTCRLTGHAEKAVGIHAKVLRSATAAAHPDTVDPLQHIALQAASRPLAHAHPRMFLPMALAEVAKAIHARVLLSGLAAALTGTVVRQLHTALQGVNLLLEHAVRVVRRSASAE
jgi:hypothetical protein